MDVTGSLVIIFALRLKKARLVVHWMKVQLGTVSEMSPAVGRRCLFAMGFAYISTD